eukprot:284818246_1
MKRDMPCHNDITLLGRLLSLSQAGGNLPIQRRRHRLSPLLNCVPRLTLYRRRVAYCRTGTNYPNRLVAGVAEISSMAGGRACLASRVAHCEQWNYTALLLKLYPNILWFYPNHLLFSQTFRFLNPAPHQRTFSLCIVRLLAFQLLKAVRRFSASRALAQLYLKVEAPTPNSNEVLFSSILPKRCSSSSRVCDPLLLRLARWHLLEHASLLCSRRRTQLRNTFPHHPAQQHTCTRITALVPLMKLCNEIAAFSNNLVLILPKSEVDLRGPPPNTSSRNTSLRNFSRHNTSRCRVSVRDIAEKGLFAFCKRDTGTISSVIGSSCTIASKRRTGKQQIFESAWSIVRVTSVVSIAFLYIG